ncbi:hypothetical protein Hanom_Chr11g01010511 [Helianthus anomalus]
MGMQKDHIRRRLDTHQFDYNGSSGSGHCVASFASLMNLHPEVFLSPPCSLTKFRVFTSKAIAGTSGLKNDSIRSDQASFDCSDDETSERNSRDEGFECPIRC